MLTPGWPHGAASSPTRHSRRAGWTGSSVCCRRGPDVLDLGCGSGEPIGRYLADRGCGLTGVDTAPEMIEFWKAALPEQSCHVADMRSLSIGRTFDGLLAWNSVFHLCPDDQRRMFPTFRAHAAPGAVLMFTSGTGYGTAFGDLEGEPLYHASLSAAEYRALLARQRLRGRRTCRRGPGLLPAHDLARATGVILPAAFHHSRRGRPRRRCMECRTEAD